MLSPVPSPASLSNPSPHLDWLLTARVTPPAQVAGYFHRPALRAPLGKVMARRITALQAPAGFGKTSAMAGICHSLKARGVTVAWLTGS